MGRIIVAIWVMEVISPHTKFPGLHVESATDL